jgi:hypothetical protein
MRGGKDCVVTASHGGPPELMRLPTDCTLTAMGRPFTATDRNGPQTSGYARAPFAALLAQHIASADGGRVFMITGFGVHDGTV